MVNGGAIVNDNRCSVNSGGNMMKVSKTVQWFDLPFAICQLPLTASVPFTVRYSPFTVHRLNTAATAAAWQKSPWY